MLDNEIISEIHRTRTELITHFGGDVKRLLAHYRELEKEYEKQGHPRVSLVREAPEAGAVVREEAPKDNS